MKTATFKCEALQPLVGGSGKDRVRGRYFLNYKSVDHQKKMASRSRACLGGVQVNREKGGGEVHLSHGLVTPRKKIARLFTATLRLSCSR